MPKPGKPRQFLCVNGPQEGLRMTRKESDEMGYIEYHISFGQGRGKKYPKAVLVKVEKE